jgi:hypothetical protein
MCRSWAVRGPSPSRGLVTLVGGIRGRTIWGRSHARKVPLCAMCAVLEAQRLWVSGNEDRGVRVPPGRLVVVDFTTFGFGFVAQRVGTKTIGSRELLTAQWLIAAWASSRVPRARIVGTVRAATRPPSLRGGSSLSPTTSARLDQDRLRAGSLVATPSRVRGPDDSRVSPAWPSQPACPPCSSPARVPPMRSRSGRTVR